MQAIDAVIPLLPKDLERFTILARSLGRFMPDLGTLYVVVPDADVLRVTELTKTERLPTRVLGEQTLVPEMRSFFYLPGWYKQQLVKLAAAEMVTTPFYLTLDADVICTRRVTLEDLLPGGRARCFVIHRDDHPDWYNGAEAVLDLKARRRGILHNVTPCVWSRQGVLELLEHLNQVARRHPFAAGIRGLQQRAFFPLNRIGTYRAEPPWRGWLAASRPWAEYATYFTFLEATGRFDDYHFDSNDCIYDVERSIWYKTSRIDDIDAESLFHGKGPPYFVVVQSNTGIDAQHTWAKLQPYIELTHVASEQ